MFSGTIKENNYLKEKCINGLEADAVKQKFRPYFSKNKGLKIICEILHMSEEEDIFEPERLKDYECQGHRMLQIMWKAFFFPYNDNRTQVDDIKLKICFRSSL
jgi:hypothetical protein